jgi:uncharacterized protein
MTNSTNQHQSTMIERFEIDSEHTQQALSITVAPGEPGSPVLYVLDPSFLFGAAVGIAALLRAGSRLTGSRFPHLTTVGIGYPTDDPVEVFKRRASDLTPTDGAANREVDLPPLHFGGGELFLSALVDEIVPTVEARYHVDHRRRALAGFSFSGLFGLYCLFHRPHTFHGYLLGSPSLWWDQRVAFTWETTWAAGHDDLAARLFLSAGANEQLVGDSWKNERFPLETLQRLKQVDNLNELATRLQERRYPSLALTTAVFDAEYHLSAPAAALCRGLLAVYDVEHADTNLPTRPYPPTDFRRHELPDSSCEPIALDDQPATI